MPTPACDAISVLSKHSSFSQQNETNSSSPSMPSPPFQGWESVTVSHLPGQTQEYNSLGKRVHELGENPATMDSTTMIGQMTVVCNKILLKGARKNITKW